MKTHYIVYYEGVNTSGNVEMNGNIALDAENPEAGSFLDYILKYALEEANKTFPHVTRIVVKGVFRL